MFVRSLCLLAVVVSLSGATAPTRANIILLVADDLGYGEVGPGQRIATPQLERLAQSGVRCAAGYVTAPYCAPSRAGLLTGRMQTRFGYENNPTGVRNTDPNVGLPLSEKTLSQVLHDAGYATSLVGKWHLGGTAAFHPQRRGFDEFFGFLHEGHYFVPPPWVGVTTRLRRKSLPDGTQGQWIGDHLQLDTALKSDEPLYDTDNPILRSSQPVDERAYLTDAFTREAVSFIHRHQDRPFFLTVTYNAVHSPMQGADAYMERFAKEPNMHRRIFSAMLANLDDSIGAVLNAVDETKMAERTLIIFISDNGGATRELTSSNLPLRGEKGQLYEGGIRVPFIVRYPGQLPAAITYAPAISSLDLFPSICAAAGIAAPAKRDGVNIFPHLRGEQQEPPHQRLYWRQNKRSALRQGDYKIVRNDGPASAWELYHLGEDLAEANDLAKSQPEKLQALVSEFEKLNSEMIEPLF